MKHEAAHWLYKIKKVLTGGTDFTDKTEEDYDGESQTQTKGL